MLVLMKGDNIMKNVHEEIDLLYKILKIDNDNDFVIRETDFDKSVGYELFIPNYDAEKYISNYSY